MFRGCDLSLHSGRKGLPKAFGMLPDRNAKIDFIFGLSSAQFITDSFWAKDITKRVKIINGNGAT